MDLRKPVRLTRWGLLAVAMAVCAGVGCAPAVGDRCAVATDCSATGSRQCDTSQPDGYCTVFDCAPNKCPDHAACAEVRASVLGCAYNDRQSPSREGRNYCLKTCNSDSDCRVSEGYACVDVSHSTTTVVLDNNPASHVCMIRQYSMGEYPEDPEDLDAAICGTNAISLDAGGNADDSSQTVDGSDDSGSDGGFDDSGSDGGFDDSGSDGGFDDSGSDGGFDDSGSDGGLDDSEAGSMSGDSASEAAVDASTGD